MAFVEQAIFTSSQSRGASGYRVVAASPGMAPEDERELALWGPSHDSLWCMDPDSVSINFHPLPSGAQCVSRTTLAGWEYSGRGGQRVFTQCLAVPPDVFARFGNNPFSLLKAVIANGSLDVPQHLPERLEPLQVTGRAAVVDQPLLARLSVSPGPRWLATLVQAALSSPRVALAGGFPLEQLIAGLFSCLPPECRLEFPFTTGLRFSLQRPFRLNGFVGEKVELERLGHRRQLAALSFDDAPPEEFAPFDGWARLVERVLAGGRTSFLATKMSKRRFELTAADLPALGLQLLEELDVTSLQDDSVAAQRPRATACDFKAGLVQQAHAAHRRGNRQRAPEEKSTARADSPSKHIDPDSPEVLEKLERLDDVVFDALGGNAKSIDELQELWPEIRNELGPDLLAESREQYLRYALAIWEESGDPSGARNPAHAVQALDVLCVLFDQV